MFFYFYGRLNMYLYENYFVLIGFRRAKIHIIILIRHSAK